MKKKYKYEKKLNAIIIIINIIMMMMENISNMLCVWVIRIAKPRHSKPHTYTK